ncbi:hypothetical protein P170DRAFT_440410 [Aspergillus steynii IBT 23096]|uniref:Uncharacterized protein n=1 Tax=Aspergillus steynii IBT 23096 TaxID=1392250 RepID=A0A2I2FXA2_9EURO|nr:uncharacterized protein P170DRAFT_440410 [Aspergillus steynii IBT 23096]PLB45269.1 hypothetical protein P170DRAFT_440410 [Aspergillus steynii IBT 23096]
MSANPNMVNAKQPVVVSIPAEAKIGITGTTNADYHQRVTVKDVTGTTQYVFQGNGEGKPLTLHGGSDNSRVSLEPITGSRMRTLAINFEHSSEGPTGTFTDSLALNPTTQTVHDAGYNVKSMSWEIASEDNVDMDYNDAIIRIVADFP